MANTTVIKIDNAKLNKVMQSYTDDKYINAGLRLFALWVQGEVQEKAPHKTGALQSSTIIDDPEQQNAKSIKNKRGDNIQPIITVSKHFQVRQAIEYAKWVFEKNSESGNPKILLQAGMNAKKFKESFKRGYIDAVRKDGGKIE
jgi:hypothetical protein